MSNICEIIRAKRNTAKAAKAEADGLGMQQLDRDLHQQQQRIEAKRGLEVIRENAFHDLTPIVKKVLLDLGPVLGEGYRVEEEIKPHDHDEDGVSNYSYAWILGKDRVHTVTRGWWGMADGIIHSEESYFDEHYAVNLIFSDTEPSHLQCVNLHSGIFVKKSFLGEKRVDKPGEPINCGFSENELANALNQLYSDQQARDKS